MAELLACPDARDLQRLTLGRLPEPEADQLGQHVLSCAHCADLLNALQAGDPVVAMLQAGVRDQQPDTPAVEALVEHLVSTLAIQTTAEGGPELGAWATVGSDGDQAELTSFLAPAQAAGELGRLGNYRILKVVGHGGMGVVFQAEDPHLGRLVALKAMLPRTARQPGMKERFLREARAAARIEHDHIIPIYQVDENRGVPYIVMPFLKGATLEDWLRKCVTGGIATPLPLAQILKLGREIARGLEAAHAAGLIHRDIKPDNIWLDSSACGRVKILDFGLARLTQSADEQHLTQTGFIIGTPAYMAPEQSKKQPLDGRADLFSLGVILYRLCTGAMPFSGKDARSTLLALAYHNPPPPRILNPSIPQTLSDLVMKLLEKDPAKRIASGQEVATTLQALARDTASGMAGEMKSAPVAVVAPVVTPVAAAQDNSFTDLTESAVPKQPPPPAAPQHIATAVPKRWPPPRRVLVIAGAAGAALVLLLAGVVLFWPTAK